MKDQLERALARLEQNYVLHANVIDCIQRNEGVLVHFDNDGILVLHQPADVYYLVPFNSVGLTKMCDVLKSRPRDAVVLTGERFLPEYRALMGTSYETPCFQAVFTKRQEVDGIRPDVEIRLIGPEYAEFVTHHYARSWGNVDYCRERLASGKMYGAFIGAQCVGFIGQHTEHSIGLLQILPEYAGKGIGKKLECFMINKLIDEGHIAYCHVVDTEHDAYRFHIKKDGVLMSQDKVIWTH